MVTAAVAAARDPAGSSELEHSTATQLISIGGALDERRHVALLAGLERDGGSERPFDAGYRLGRFGDHQIVSFLATSRSPGELVARFERIEPLLYLGNRTETCVSDGRLEVRHVGRDGFPPTTSESAFVCGAQVGMLERIGCEQVSVPAISQARWLESAGDQRKWRITWNGGPAAPPFSPSGSLVSAVRKLVADQPSLRWTLATAAAEMQCSPRTLQRRMSEEGDRFAVALASGRLDAAEALLRRTRLPISTIAYLCGFADASHLANSCRANRGLTPSALRTSELLP